MNATKEIRLGKSGKFALVDVDDFERLSQFNWSYASAHKGYSLRREQIGTKDGKMQFKTVFMHREILQAPEGLVVDHINGISLDNRKSNLRIATRAQNLQAKSGMRNNTSGYRGVSFNKALGKWGAYISINKKLHCLGLYPDITEAVLAYNQAASTHYGQFAKLNQVPATPAAREVL